MVNENENSILTTRISTTSAMHQAFTQWQADFNAAIATFPGFISLEILSPINRIFANWVGTLFVFGL